MLNSIKFKLIPEYRKNESVNGADIGRSANYEGLRWLLINGLNAVYHTEVAHNRVIPGMIENAITSEMVDDLLWLQKVIRKNMKQLEHIFSMMDANVNVLKSEPMEMLIAEAEKMLEETEVGIIRDVRLIAALRKMECYKIATYGTLSYFSRRIGEDAVTTILESILKYEKDADAYLLKRAEFFINRAEAVE